VANARTTGGSAGRSVDASAKTVDEAVARALELLGCQRDEVDVEVLHPGSPGRLLGFGAEPARVRVTRLAAEAPAVAARNKEDDEFDTQRARFGGAPATTAVVAGRGTVSEEAAAATEELAAEPEDEEATAARAGDAELSRLMLAELLSRMGLEGVRAEVAATDPITLNIVGDDVADLIGRRGENLRALQFVLGLMLNKQLHRHVRIVVDVDGYRARREELLRSMASRFAYRVRATREPMQLEAMPPNERRVVHMALSEDPDVTTESIGEGDARRVVIKPRR
jgi:spoIIIJ-associated protein